jgi:uncharacterized protein (TIGR04255 family)
MSAVSAHFLMAPPAHETVLPRKLKDDAIVEALCELRFETEMLPEVVVGRLVDEPSRLRAWQRLPTADLPQLFIAANPDLRFQPSFELADASRRTILRIGPNMISYHCLAPYPGWEHFKADIATAIQRLFDALPEVTLTRAGLRYVNSLSMTRHHIGSVHQLCTQTTIADAAVTGPMLLRFERQVASNHRVASQLASADFAKGVTPDSTAIVDIDVYTTASLGKLAFAQILAWIEEAHAYEKIAFFELIPSEILRVLVEE